MTMQTYNTVTSQNRLSNENGEFYQRAMLKALKERAVIFPYGKKAPIPKNAGGTTSWRSLQIPSAVTTAITEGTTPNSIDLTINKYSASVSQYGAWTKISDFLDMAGLDPLLTEVAEMFGDHAAISIDKIVANVLAGTTNSIFAGGKTARSALAAGDVLCSEDIIKARNEMVKNNVPQIRLANGSMGYVAFIHPDNVLKLMNESGGAWATFNSGGSTEGLAQFRSGEIGQMYGIHFVETTSIPDFTDGGSGGNLSGKKTIIIGADAFGVPDIAGSSKPEILVYGNGNTENPMALYKTVAWKATFAAVLFHAKATLCIESLDV